MTKKKTLAKINVASSFFSMHRHARWLLGIFILVSILFLVVSHIADIRQHNEVKRIFIQARNNAISWKTYANPVGKFSIQYPGNWKLVESHEMSNSDVDDLEDINTATISGGDGEIVLQWGPMGFGGGCQEEGKTTILLKEHIVSACRGITDGKIYWSQIYPTDGNPDFGARATATGEESESIVKNIFSTLSFSK